MPGRRCGAPGPFAAHCPAVNKSANVAFFRIGSSTDSDNKHAVPDTWFCALSAALLRGLACGQSAARCRP